MAFVKRLITRTSQPQDGAQLDKSGEFYSRLVAVLDPISRRDLVTGKAMTIVGGFPKTAGKYGVSAKGDGASLGYIAVSGLGAEISMLGVMNNATCVATGSLEFGLGSSAGTALACYQANNNPNNRFLLRQTNGGGTSTTEFSASGRTTGPYVVAASFIGSLASEIIPYFNGQPDQGNLLNGSSGTNSTFTRFSIGGLSRSTNTGALVDDDCALAVLFSGALSAAEHKSLSDNPWQIFEPEVQRVWIDDFIDVGGGTSLTAPLLTNGQTFYGPGISQTGGVQSLTAPLLTNTSTLFAPAATPGAVSATAPLLTNSSTLFTPAISAGGTGLTAPLLTNSPTFFAPAVAPGAVNLSAPLFTNASALYTPAIVNGIVVSPPYFENANSFYSPAVTPGTVALAAALFTNTSTVFPARIVIAGVAVFPLPSQVLAGVEYGPTGAEYLGTLTGGAAPTAAEIADAVIAAAQTTPIWADTRRMNGATVYGNGTSGDKWRG